jgi:paraquat-inducible protein B
MSPDPDLQNAPIPKIKKMRFPFPVIWVVPLLAACLAGYYLHEHHQETGLEINISFDDGAGLKPGETVVSLRGVVIGHVRKVDLSEDHRKAVAHVQLSTSAEFIAKTNTLFWLVRPELSLQNISGLNTLVSGAYIDCRPGDGGDAHSFNGLNGAPPVVAAGLKIIVSADQVGAMTIDSPVNFRGIQVGIVRDIRLSNNAESANITLVIWDRYRTLVRSNSVFWTIKGADISGSLFGGLSLKLGSVQNILTGGVAFATPEKAPGNLVIDSTAFVLHDRPEDDWLKWRAKLPLPPQPDDTGDRKRADESDSNLPTLKHE